jgi:hypothetical protein
MRSSFEMVLLKKPWVAESLSFDAHRTFGMAS